MRTPLQKQKILDAFAKIGITPTVKKARLDGWFIYHPFGQVHTRCVQCDVQFKDNVKTYYRGKVEYTSDWIGDDDTLADCGGGIIESEFDSMLEMVVEEAKHRQQYYYRINKS